MATSIRRANKVVNFHLNQTGKWEKVIVSNTAVYNDSEMSTKTNKELDLYGYSISFHEYEHLGSYIAIIIKTGERKA